MPVFNVQEALKTFTGEPLRDLIRVDKKTNEPVFEERTLGQGLMVLLQVGSPKQERRSPEILAEDNALGIDVHLAMKNGSPEVEIPKNKLTDLVERAAILQDYRMACALQIALTEPEEKKEE